MRKGVSFNDMILTIVIVMFVIGILYAAVNAMVNVEQETATAENLTYRMLSNSEKILNAPCATIGRGIFLESSVRAGTFDCVNVTHLRLGFNVSGECGEGGQCHFFELKRENKRTNIAAIKRDAFTNLPVASSNKKSLTLPVAVYNDATGERENAMLEVIILG